MKPLLSLILFSSVSLSTAMAQHGAGQDSVRVQPHQQVRHAPKSDTRLPTHRPVFRDENGDGLDDRTHRQSIKQNAHQVDSKGSNVDCFIDTDGDGINDNRCGGMGIAPSMTTGQHKGKQK